jgi:hypothetical protein
MKIAIAENVRYSINRICPQLQESKDAILRYDISEIKKRKSSHLKFKNE